MTSRQTAQHSDEAHTPPCLFSHRFSETHAFEKPNDAHALELMNHAARHVMDDMRPEISLAFGESDEYSFLLRRSCSLYKRRQSKLVTHVVSLFTSAYLFFWASYFPDKKVQYPPSFDGRLVVYPGEKEVRDYFAWRQADSEWFAGFCQPILIPISAPAHVNNLYNTTFWTLISQGGQSEKQAHETLKGTVSSDKHEILHRQYSINYDRLPALFRKGTTLAWHEHPAGTDKKKSKAELRTLHVDIIGPAFWKQCPGTAPPMQSVLALESPEASVWLQPCRTSDSDGLGRRALDV